MTFRTLLASLIALTLLASLPATHVQAAASDCASAVSAPAADDCCDTGDMASCFFACSAAPAAVGKAGADAVPFHTASPLDNAAAQARSVSRPPETAPPKPLSA